MARVSWKVAVCGLACAVGMLASPVARAADGETAHENGPAWAASAGYVGGALGGVLVGGLSGAAISSSLCAAQGQCELAAVPGLMIGGGLGFVGGGLSGAVLAHRAAGGRHGGRVLGAGAAALAGGALIASVGATEPPLGALGIGALVAGPPVSVWLAGREEAPVTLGIRAAPGTFGLVVASAPRR